MSEQQDQSRFARLQAILGFILVIVSGAFALTMIMRFVGRFLIFLVVDRPEIGFGFLLSTFATTALGVYVAWQVAKKGIELSSRGRTAEPVQELDGQPAGERKSDEEKSTG